MVVRHYLNLHVLPPPLVADPALPIPREHSSCSQFNLLQVDLDDAVTVRGASREGGWPTVTLRMRGPRCTALIFRSGRCVLVGNGIAHLHPQIAAAIATLLRTELVSEPVMNHVNAGVRLQLDVDELRRRFECRRIGSGKHEGCWTIRTEHVNLLVAHRFVACVGRTSMQGLVSAFQTLYQQKLAECVCP